MISHCTKLLVVQAPHDTIRDIALIITPSLITHPYQLDHGILTDRRRRNGREPRELIIQLLWRGTQVTKCVFGIIQCGQRVESDTCGQSIDLAAQRVLVAIIVVVETELRPRFGINRF